MQSDSQNTASYSEEAIRAETEKLVGLCQARKEQVKGLLVYLEKAGFYSAPASAAYHNNHCGGLAGHAINVTRVLLTIKHRLLAVQPWPDAQFEWMGDAAKVQLPQISDESCIIVGLFHDVHKVTDGFGRACYVPNVGKGGKVSEAKPYEHNKESMAFSGSCKSALIVEKFIELKEHELQAIVYHDGQYVPAGREVAMKEHPLTLMLHFADMWSAALIEDENSWLYRPISELSFLK